MEEFFHTWPRDVISTLLLAEQSDLNGFGDLSLKAAWTRDVGRKELFFQDVPEADKETMDCTQRRDL